MQRARRRRFRVWRVFWEPRPPMPAEIVDPHALGGMSWEPQTLREDDWLPTCLRGPSSHASTCPHATVNVLRAGSPTSEV
jgi:hypothetical protein